MGNEDIFESLPTEAKHTARACSAVFFPEYGQYDRIGLEFSIKDESRWFYATLMIISCWISTRTLRVSQPRRTRLPLGILLLTVHVIVTAKNLMLSSSYVIACRRPTSSYAWRTSL
ncbi:hypothetical protein BDW71DRAFT_50806 [Aspergillus fruticulosus]